MSFNNTSGNWVCLDYNLNLPGKCTYGYYFSTYSTTLYIYYRYSNLSLILTDSIGTNIESRDLRQYTGSYWIQQGNHTITQPVNYTLQTVPVLEGYTYRWSKNTAGSGTTYTTGNSISIDYNIDMYAIPTANTYIVTFNYNNGSENTTTTLKYATTLTFPTTTPTRTGYTFTGWNDGTTTYTSNITYNYASNKTFTAQWTANTYTLTLDPNGKGTGKIISVNFNSNITVPILKAVGYTFNGYYNDPSGSTLEVSGGNTYTMPLSNKTLYAKWSDNIIVKFSDLQDTYGGSYPIRLSEYQASISKQNSILTKLKLDFKGTGPEP